MRDLLPIEALWIEIDLALEAELASLAATGSGKVLDQQVLDDQAGRGSAFALAMKHYNSRNQIAHGRLMATRIDVSAFVADCYLIQSALHRAA